MRILITVLLLCISAVVFAQVNTSFRGTLNIYQASGTSPNYEIRGIFNDTQGQYTSDSVDVGDKIFILEAENCIELEITSLISTTGGIIRCNVIDVDTLLVNPPLANAAIMEATGNFGFPTFVDGISNDLLSCIQTYFTHLVDNAITGSGDGDGIYGRNDTIPAGRISNADNFQILDENGSTNNYHFKFQPDNELVSMRADSVELELSNKGGIFYDYNVIKEGLQYAQNGYVTQDRSLTDKEYVDNLVAGLGSGDALLKDTVYQASHGFVLPTHGFIPVYNNAGTWTLAQADDTLSLHTNYIVEILHTDTIVLQVLGRLDVTGHGLTVGSSYFLTDAGGVSTTGGTHNDYMCDVMDANTLMLVYTRPIYAGTLDTVAYLRDTTLFDGDVSGTYDNLQLGTGVVGATELASTAVTPSSYGDATNIPAITVDVDGRITAASIVATDKQQIDSLSLSGTTLNASLSNDGVAAKTVDLSPILTGYVSGTSAATTYIPRWTSLSPPVLSGDSRYRFNDAYPALEIIGSYTSNPTQLLLSSGGSNPRIQTSSNNNGLIFAVGGNGTYTFQNTTGTTRFEIVGGSSRSYFNTSLGIGFSTTPSNMLDVEGSVAIGAGYSGSNAAPTNGLIVQGNTAIGLTTASARLHVRGIGSTSVTYPLFIDNSSSTGLFGVTDAGGVHAYIRTGTATTLAGWDTNSKSTDITKGAGLTLTAGTLDVNRDSFPTFSTLPASQNLYTIDGSINTTRAVDIQTGGSLNFDMTYGGIFMDKTNHNTYLYSRDPSNILRYGEIQLYTTTGSTSYLNITGSDGDSTGYVMTPNDLDNGPSFYRVNLNTTVEDRILNWNPTTSEWRFYEKYYLPNDMPADSQMIVWLSDGTSFFADIPSGTGGSGEVNTASNLGAGAGVYEQKVSLDLQLNSLVSESTTALTIAEDDPNNTIDFTINTGAVTNGAGTLTTGDQVYDFVTGQGYLTAEVDGSTTNEAWTIDGDDADTEVISNQTVKFQGAGITATDYNTTTDVLLITSTEVDGSVSNEGSLTVGAGGGNTSTIVSNTSGSTDVTISGGTGITVTEAGSTITVANSGDTNAADDITGTVATGQVPYATGANVVAGTNNLAWNNTNTGLSIISETLTGGRGLNIQQHSTDIGGAAAAFVKSRGTFASQTAVASGDIIGAFPFKGYSGTQYLSDNALFGASATGTITTSSVPTSLFFISGATSNYSPDLLIHSGGNIGIGSSGTGNITSTINTPPRTATVYGEMRVTDLTTDAPTQVVGADADGDFGALALSGMSVTGGTLTASSSTIFTGTADATVANTITETTLIPTGVGTVTLPANYLIAGKTIKIDAWGIWTEDAVPSTLELRAELGGTLLCTTGAQTMVTSEGGEWHMEVIFTCRSTGVSGTIYSQGEVDFMSAFTTSVKHWMRRSATNAIDTTVSNAIDLTATHGAADADNSITTTNITVTVLN
jgi:hypothetical protein